MRAPGDRLDLRDMKHRVHTHTGGQGKFNRHRTDDTDNGKGTNEAGRQLPRDAWHREVLGAEVYFLPRDIHRGRSPTAVGDPGGPFLCPQQVGEGLLPDTLAVFMEVP